MCIPNSVPMRRMRSSISVRCTGSSPSVGSSRSTSSGIVGDRRCELHALSLPGRHRPDRAEALLAEPDEPECVVGPLHGGPVREEVHLGEVPHEVGRGELGRQIVVLGRVADARSQLDARRRRVVSENVERAAVARTKSERERDERGLPGAVRAEQARDAGADVGVEPCERDGAAVALDDATGGDHAGEVGGSQASACASSVDTASPRSG